MIRRLLLVASLLIGPALVAAGPAAADCEGPTIEYDAGEVVRGDTIHVVGSAWGDNCYDTGPPPAGEGVLGNPLQGIEVLIVQDDLEVVVARGDADMEYGFAIDAMVPVELEPGDARVTARAAAAFNVWDRTDTPLTVLDAPPRAETTTVATFESGPIDFPVIEADDDGDDERTVLYVIVGIVVVVCVLGAAHASRS